MKLRPWWFLLAIVLFWANPAACVVLPQLRDGDIIFHTSRSSQSLAIQRAAGSRYSHMGVIVHRDGKPHVFEAVGRVSYTPLQAWIERGVDGHHVVRRLRKPLSSARANGAASFDGRVPGQGL